MTNKNFDFVIIGSGLAGLFAALHASKFGTVALISKTELQVSNSYLAQGGVAAAISKEDSPFHHIEDTLKTGRGLCSNEAVEILVNEGIEIIESLIRSGMKFDSRNGDLLFGLEGGHSARRILHSDGDSTGAALVNFIFSLVAQNKNIFLFENFYAFKLLFADFKCTGVACLNLASKETVTFSGKSIFIASGGASALYSRSTNPGTTTGSGIALAYNAGAETESMEFIQFHPTSFYSETGETFLISEAVRGEGAYLVNWKGERFLHRWNSSELSPRDQVAIAIYNELKESGQPNVYLKLSHLNPRSVKERFQFIYKMALKKNIDISKDPVPVAPAAHYTVGGIKTDLFGATNLKGLYAIGEAASTRIHGANRLASNSLLECLVFAKRAVEHAAINLAYTVIQPMNPDRLLFDFKNMALHERTKEKVGKIMWNYAGIVKTERELERALDILSGYEEQIRSGKEEYFLRDSEFMITVSKMIIESALLREESRGCHIRSDFSEPDSRFEKIIILKKGVSPRFEKINISQEIKCG